MSHTESVFLGIIPLLKKYKKYVKGWQKIEKKLKKTTLILN
jgi:hypothetical protein